MDISFLVELGRDRAAVFLREGNIPLELNGYRDRDLA
jgi:hypothetical protein